MGYIDDHLISDEKLIYRGYLHKIIFIKPVIIIVAGVLLWWGLGWLMDWAEASPTVRSYSNYVPLAVVAFGVLWGLWIWLDYTTSEFGVTNKRVLIKTGLIRRRTVEMFLNKVENIGVDQTVMGRIIGSGSLTMTGSGGTQEHFKNIGRPLDFRRQVHEQISESSERDGDLGEHD